MASVLLDAGRQVMKLDKSPTCMELLELSGSGQTAQEHDEDSVNALLNEWMGKWMIKWMSVWMNCPL